MIPQKKILLINCSKIKKWVILMIIFKNLNKNYLIIIINY